MYIHRSTPLRPSIPTSISGFPFHFPAAPSPVAPSPASDSALLGLFCKEYAMIDVFSFGVLVLEILTSRKNTDLNLQREMQILLHWAWGLYIRGQSLDIMDSALGDLMCPVEQALRCIHIGLLCAQADAAARPPMSSIFLMLSSNYIALPNPTIPAFVRVTDKGKFGFQSERCSRVVKDVGRIVISIFPQSSRSFFQK